MLRIAAVAALLFGSMAQAAGLTPDMWRRDLAHLRGQVEAVHPDPFHKLPRAEFDARLDALSRDLPELSESQVVVRIAEAVAALGDGHTRLTLPMTEDAGFFLGHAKTAAAKVAAFHHLPIRLTRAADGYVVTRAAPAQRALLGAKLEAIDGKPASAVEAALGPVVHADNASMRSYYLPTFMVVPEVLHARGIAADPLTSLWRFRDARGHVVETRLAPMPREEVRWTDLRAAPAPPAGAKGERLWFDRRSDGLIHARITDVLDQPGQTIPEFADVLYAAVAAAPDARLVIDLRGNPGGNNGLIDPLVRGAVRAEKLWEPGRLFVLTDGGTFSAAQNLVNAFARWTPAILVGAPTGAAPNAYGDSKRVVLPESGLTVRISSLYWQDGGPQDRRDAVAPHIDAVPTIADLRTGHDPALAAIAMLRTPATLQTGVWGARMNVAHRAVEARITLASSTAGTFAIPSLDIPATPFEQLIVDGDHLEALVRIRDRPIRLHARFVGDRLVGWVDLSGRPHAFVADRSNPKVAKMDDTKR